MSLSIQFAAASDKGRVRKRNEDSWNALPERGLFVVADGLGGQDGGVEASRLVVHRLPVLLAEQQQHAGADEALTSALRALHGEVTLLGEQRYGTRIGSTVVAALLRGDEFLIAHLGDSRAYRLREHTLDRLTGDHTIVGLLLEMGDIAEEEAATHPAKGRLTRYIGMEGDLLPEVKTVELRAGDRLLLCTDGLWEMVPQAELQSALAGGTAEEAAELLIERANAHGGRDNVTALVLQAS